MRVSTAATLERMVHRPHRFGDSETATARPPSRCSCSVVSGSDAGICSHYARANEMKEHVKRTIAAGRTGGPMIEPPPLPPPPPPPPPRWEARYCIASSLLMSSMRIVTTRPRSSGTDGGSSAKQSTNKGVWNARTFLQLVFGVDICCGPISKSRKQGKKRILTSGARTIGDEDDMRRAIDLRRVDSPAYQRIDQRFFLRL